MSLWQTAILWTFNNNITVTWQWTRWRLKSPASRLFTQSFIQAQIKENIKVPRHWPLCGEFTGHRWIPRTNGQLRGKYFHLMMSPWLSVNFDIKICVHVHLEVGCVSSVQWAHFTKMNYFSSARFTVFVSPSFKFDGRFLLLFTGNYTTTVWL